MLNSKTISNLNEIDKIVTTLYNVERVSERLIKDNQYDDILWYLNDVLEYILYDQEDSIMIEDEEGNMLTRFIEGRKL